MHVPPYLDRQADRPLQQARELQAVDEAEPEQRRGEHGAAPLGAAVRDHDAEEGEEGDDARGEHVEADGEPARGEPEEEEEGGVGVDGRVVPLDEVARPLEGADVDDALHELVGWSELSEARVGRSVIQSDRQAEPTNGPGASR